ncbi:Uncharacterized protein Rs2_49673 [Raphanus sativus]|nr:Uncharacterized protein Rs2_49673 [Raphanus sativus]
MGEETNVMEQLAIMMAKIENMGSELKSDLRSLTERVNVLESQSSSPKAQDVKKKGVLQDHSSAIKFSAEELSEVENFSRSKGGKALPLQAAMLAMETFAAVHEEACEQPKTVLEEIHEEKVFEEEVSFLVHINLVSEPKSLLPLIPN